ncbi:MAG TPA: DNA/RNA non-specific endonuclease [Saprospiraceae bacterium]|nr:DNA/RNA non-specific endonuclease [Saprospiraceae bacterium]HND89546.1 DNA/RNA non-specific endonuclease [Saprospiraceae bacterium]
MNNNLLPTLCWATLSLLPLSDVSAQNPSAQSQLSAPTRAEMEKTQDAAHSAAQQLSDAKRDYETARLALVEAQLRLVGLPRMTDPDQDKALQKKIYPGYIVGFSAEHSQPQWSAHLIPRDIFDVCLTREEDFFEDLSLKGAARLSQYRGSGFQRGHMAPAADFRWSPRASVASNTLSNIAPQPAAMNEGLWAELENSIRGYLHARDSVSELYVVTGPVLRQGLKKMKDTSSVSVPKQFYKVVLNLRDQEGYAFVMDTTASKAKKEAEIKAELSKCAMSIKELEAKIKIDFFPNLTEAQRDKVEAEMNIERWFSEPGWLLDCKPITDSALLTDAFNTISITSKNRSTRKAVVGTVARITVGAGGGVTLFLDEPSSQNRFFIQVQERDAKNFKTPPLVEMLGKVVRAEGSISPDGDRFKMSIRDEKKLRVLK